MCRTLGRIGRAAMISLDGNRREHRWRVLNGQGF
jgi:hypothetical protein